MQDSHFILIYCPSLYKSAFGISFVRRSFFYQRFTVFYGYYNIILMDVAI